MVAAAAAVAAGWTIEQVAAGVGIAGTVGGAVGQAAASGTSGWNFAGPAGNVHYPAEVGPQLFLGDGHERGGTLISFVADGYVWDNECCVRYHGLFSDSSETPMSYTNGGYPGVPANRFLEVGFTKGGEELGSGLLTCGLSTYAAGVHGDYDNPFVIVHAAGHFDPVGSGDAEYGFNLYISTFGTVHLGNIDAQTGGIEITEVDDHVRVRLAQ
jgi:hypothetical protein